LFNKYLLCSCESGAALGGGGGSGGRGLVVGKSDYPGAGLRSPQAHLHTTHHRERAKNSVSQENILTLTSVASPCLIILAQVVGSLLLSK